MIDKADLMTKAIQLRKELGEDSNSPVDIFSLVLNIERLTLVYYPMGDNLSGMCIKGKSGDCVIAINSAMSLGRQRFSLAHEFYHLRYDDNMLSVCGKKIGDGKDIEKEADMFASYFLIPAAELECKSAQLAAKHEDGKLSLDDIIRLEQYFGASHQAMVIRLKESTYMNRARVEDYLMSSVRNRAEMMGYSSELYRPLPAEKQYKTYGHYINQADQLLKKDLISNGKYEELLMTAFRPDLVYGEEEDGDVVD
ncbi:ImmA/IrrE family metallo-endopeptidase [Dehalobacter sp.]|uniref:ImmA/IrrE family metallo-endopeptidase n=1 Tax=Dehalobacter sp. TaxID=1962289 RepID=UPI002583B28E|nr:ImmA/IrrE family metallo-endopeptidase [Dehalobacter sp.]MDJ0304683.1 ImmA/IrrE family metallo-endopeptidase [Dehalobacter sp.]